MGPNSNQRASTTGVHILETTTPDRAVESSIPHWSTHALEQLGHATQLLAFHGQGRSKILCQKLITSPIEEAVGMLYSHAIQPRMDWLIASMWGQMVDPGALLMMHDNHNNIFVAIFNKRKPSFRENFSLHSL
eukprot:2960338-Amphidinium_carterae.1